VGAAYLDARLETLERHQNSDGGWGYFPRRQTWLEPTFYAALALHGRPSADRAWTLIKSLQQPDGSWRPSAEVDASTWVTALCVTMCSIRGEMNDAGRRGAAWLLQTSGGESRLMNRALTRAGRFFGEDVRDVTLEGWPWKPNTSSWVEPTAHALLALKKSAAMMSVDRVAPRIRMGEAQLLDVRCRDHGWNYGSRSAIHIDLPSYPETTGIALLGLQGRQDLGPSLEVARNMYQDTRSPMARAWLGISLQLHGKNVPEPEETGLTPDLMITALEAIRVGSFQLLAAGGPQ
jgi:hypothetical protein